MNASVLLLPLFMCITGSFLPLVMGLCALAVHETAHLVSAKRMGASVPVLWLYPFGAVAQVTGCELPRHESWVALSGPVVSLVTGGLALSVITFTAEEPEALRLFAYANLSLALINLLPCFPLDGGRALCAALSPRLGERAMQLLFCIGGIVAGCLLLGFAAVAVLYGSFLPSLIFFAGYIVYAAVVELCAVPEKRVLGLVRRRGAVLRGRAVPLRCTVMHGALSPKEALRELRSADFNLVRVVDDRMKLVGELCEAEIIEALGGACTSLFELCMKNSR